MTEVLSQDKTDKILTAGDAEPEVFKPAADTRKIKPHGFKRPGKFSKEQIRSMVHARVGEPFSLNVGIKKKFLYLPGVAGKKWLYKLLKNWKT